MTWAQYEDTYGETRDEHRGPWPWEVEPEPEVCACGARIDTDGYCFNECPKEKK